MWWGVLCVLVLHFYDELAQLNEESEHDKISDFVDYDEESESSQLEILHHVRARRKEDTQGVLTPMSLESNAIEDTTVAVTRSTKLDQNLTTAAGSTARPDFTPALSKSDLYDDLGKQKEELQSIDVREDKDIDVKNTLIKFIEENRKTIVELAKQRATKQEATSNSKTTATEDTSTNSPTASRHPDKTNSKINLENGNRNVITHITWSALNDFTTVKEVSDTRTASSDTSSTIPIKEELKDTVKLITWEVETDNTLTDSSVSLQDEYLANKEVSSRRFATQNDVSTLETTSSLQTMSFLTYITKENTATETTTDAIRAEEISTESTFVFPQGTVDMPITKTSGFTGIARQKIPTKWTKPIVDHANKKIDVQRLLELLDSMAYEDANRFNLTRKFHESLQKYHIPTCVPPGSELHLSPTTEPPSTINYNDAKVIAKCFVCGMDVERVPYSTACADAFSGDFIPLVPIDAKARGQIANYRKYCRYLDVNRVVTKEDEPHSVFGRFTGGCSVRWVDLTSIYTQRTCRNRRRAVLGKHFGSKRMAKLEMALSDLDNGCIISPMATLLPVSRGISLYARFHACVCTGSWCNKAVVTRNWITNNVLMFIVVTYLN